MDCVTPSNPVPISPGEAIDIYKLAEKLEDWKRTHSRVSVFGEELSSVQNMAKIVAELDLEKDELARREKMALENMEREDLPYLKAQLARDLDGVRKERNEVIRGLRAQQQPRYVSDRPPRSGSAGGAGGMKYPVRPRRPSEPTVRGGSVRGDGGTGPANEVWYIARNAPKHATPILFLPFDDPVPEGHNDSVIIRVGQDLAALGYGKC